MAEHRSDDHGASQGEIGIEIWVRQEHRFDLLSDGAPSQRVSFIDGSQILHEILSLGDLFRVIIKAKDDLVLAAGEDFRQVDAHDDGGIKILEVEHRNFPRGKVHNLESRFLGLLFRKRKESGFAGFLASGDEFDFAPSVGDVALEIVVPKENG